MTVALYAWQRATAALMAPLVVVHLVVIFYAMGSGLSAAQMLARTRGSIAWGLFYGVFVAAVSVHAAIGVRTILIEWTPLPRRAIDWLVILFGLALAGLGLRAVVAVVLP